MIHSRTTPKMEFPCECATYTCRSHTKNTGKLFEVYKATGALIHQSECPQCKWVSVCTVWPGTQEMMENPELLAVNAILVKIWQTGIMMLQDRTIYTPITGKKVLFLQRKDKMLDFLKQQLSLGERCEKLTMLFDLKLTRKTCWISLLFQFVKTVSHPYHSPPLRWMVGKWGRCHITLNNS